MQPKKFTGKLIAIDMYNCGVNEVNDTEKAKTLLQEGCDEYRMNSHELLVCQEEGQSEYSISALCKQGHVTLHVYPKLGFIAADIFSCYDDADLRAWLVICAAPLTATRLKLPCWTAAISAANTI